jgi:hypothetical protein
MRRSFLLTPLLAAAVATHTSAQSTDGAVVLHGFGGWAYGQSDQHNSYLAGLPGGNYRRASMAISLVAPVSERLTIRAQGESIQSEDGPTMVLDYAFADYKLADHLSLRVGEVKHPFGIYTEVFTVGTLRPFIDLPQAVYGAVGFAGQAYDGAGLSGDVDLGRWNLTYDLYGGGYTLQEFRTPEAFLHGEDVSSIRDEVEIESTRNLFGTRVMLHTPLHGLSFGTSVYTGQLAEIGGRLRTVVAGSVDYRSNAFSLEAEIAHEDEVRDQHVTGAYVQAAYRFHPSWQIGVQLDNLHNDFIGGDASRAPSLTQHREVAGVLSYWFSRSLAIKGEFHAVNGNRLAMPEPEDFSSILAAGGFRTRTRLVQLGAQFSF